MPGTDETKNAILAWDRTVQLQMHFNDLCLKLRNVAISILGVLLGAAALTYRYAGKIQIFSCEIHTAVIFMIIAIVLWSAFYLMDRFWYHELLRGAVRHGQKIEKRLKDVEPNLCLAHTVRKQSHKSLNMSAAKKLNIFYTLILTILVIGTLTVFFGSLKISS